MDKKFELILRDNFEECLENFDFHKVHEVMDFLDWKWCGYDEVPNEYAMITTARELFEDCLKYEKNGNSQVGTRGFTIEIWDSGLVEVRFVLESWTSENCFDSEDELDDEEEYICDECDYVDECKERWHKGRCANVRWNQ